MVSDQQTYMNSCEFDIMHNIVFAGVGQLLNLGEGPRSNLSYHVSNFKATTLPYFFRIPHLKGILGLIQWLEPYPHHIHIHCHHHYHQHPYPLQLCECLALCWAGGMHFHICVPWLVKAGGLDAYHQYDGDHNHHGDCHHRSHFNRYDDNHNFRYFGKVHLKRGLLWTRKIQHVVWTSPEIPKPR